MLNQKKAMGAVVAIASFMIVTVVSVISFQNWCGTFVDIETQSNSVANLEILQMVAGNLYV